MIMEMQHFKTDGNHERSSKGKFIAMNAYIKKKRKISNKHLYTSETRKEKEEQLSPKLAERKKAEQERRAKIME